MKKYLILFSLSLSSLFSNSKIIVDPYFSPYAGGEDLLFVHWSLEKGMDLFGPEIKKDTTLRVWGRALEQLFVWEPVNSVSSIIQHEVFGHGYRLRELGVRPKKYEIALWEGATYFEVEDSFSLGKLSAITVAGLEGEAILANQVKMQWVGNRKINGRLSTLYTQTEQSIFWYTLITHLGHLKGDKPLEGNDINDYIDLLNAFYPENKIGIGTLTQWAAFNWLDPMTFFAYFSWFYYIAEGAPWKFPMFELKEGVYYLPNARIGYAPYAPEAYFENFFSVHETPLYVYFKGGQRSLGLGFAYDYLLSGEKGVVGLHMDCWVQPSFLTHATIGEFLEGVPVSSPQLNQKIFGIAYSLTCRLNFSKRAAFFGQIGGKTKGYLPGYQLSGGLIARVGLEVGTF